ncbi:hypothetical protein predicted by Glimmer/Critica [Limosilactobacillus fermentum]|nr:hypothetical protein predicted by Glimmer/Critica [Limosilactobacillus fermentum]
MKVALSGPKGLFWIVLAASNYLISSSVQVIVSPP